MHDARRFAGHARDAAVAAGDVHLELNALWLLLGVEARSESTRWADVERLAKAVLERPQCDARTRAHALMHLGGAALARGDTAAADALAAESIQLLLDLGQELDACSMTNGPQILAWLRRDWTTMERSARL